MATLAEHIKYREVIFAAIYAPPMNLTRKQATELYSNLADKGFPNLEFQYVPAAEGQPFKVVMTESQGTRKDTITVEMTRDGSLRLLVNHAWPEAFDIAVRKTDSVKQVFDNIIAESSPQCLIHLIEVRVLAQTPAPKGDATRFLLNRIFGPSAVPSQWSQLGRVSHWGFHFETSIGQQEPVSPLDWPCRDVTVEPLREDPRSLYINAMSNWGRTLLRGKNEAPEQAEIAQGPLAVSEKLPAPSEYFGEVRQYIESTLCPFLEREP